jgi:small-conductance mechanosensitive channel
MLPISRALSAVLLSIALILVDGLAPRVSAQGQTAPAGPDEIVTAPVVIDGEVLFHVRGTTSFPADVRAGLIRERLIGAARDPTLHVESLQLVTTEGAIRIAARDRPLMLVVEADAALEQVSAPDLAAAHLVRIRQAIANYREARSRPALQRDVINVLAATILLGGAIVAIVWLSRKADRLLMRRLGSTIHAVEVQSLELMRAERIWAAARGLALALRTLVMLAAALMYVGFVLAQFPWTRELSQNMVAFALRPLNVIVTGIVAQIPSLIFLTVLFFVVRMILRLTRVFFDAVGRGTVTLASFDADWAEPTYKIVRVVIVAFGLIVAYPYIPGSESAAFKGISLFMGVVFSLGSSTAIANVVAGYMMTYRRAFKVGDRIKIGNSVGDVIETRLQVTHLRSPKNEELIIPNSQILTGEVLNYSSLARSDGLILHTEVGIGYETPWRQVEAMLLMAAERTSGVTLEFPPFILETRLADFAVTYELNVHCRNAHRMMEIYAELHRHILDVFNEYGVQIMTPAYIADTPEPKLVAAKDWYMAPARRRDRVAVRTESP